MWGRNVEDRLIEDLHRRNSFSRPELQPVAGGRDADRRAQAEWRFRTLVESAPDGIVIVDPRGRIEFANRQVEELFGYTAEELLGEPLELLVPERLRGLHVLHRDAYAARPRRRPMGVDLDLHARRRDGSEFPVEIGLSPIETPDGAPPSVMALITDISERRRAEEEQRRVLHELEAAEERFRSLVESAPDAIVIVGREGRIELVNRQAEQMFGYRPEELLGQSVELLVPEHLRETHGRLRDRYAEAPRLRPMGAVPDLAVRRKDGSEFPAEIRLAPIRSCDGELRVMSLISDVTEEKERERQLREHARRLETLAEVQRAIIEARSPGEIAEVSVRSLRRLLGAKRVTISELDPDTDDLVLVAVDVGDASTALRVGARAPLSLVGELEALARGVVHSQDDLATVPDPPPAVRALLDDGIRATVSIPLLAGGRLVGTLNLAQDRPGPVLAPEALEVAREVADRAAVALSEAHLRAELRRYTEELEERVRERTGELEAANAELESFSYSVSHDLRAPLRAIDGFARILAEEAPAHLPEDLRRYLGLIDTNVRNMGLLIDGLLDFSRLGRRALTLESVSLESLAREAAAEVSAVAGGSARVEIGPLPVVRGDRVLLKQVLVNLLSNAVKFSAGRDRPAIEVGSTDGDGSPVVFVRDNGVGFDPRYAEKLFGVFQRLHRAEEFEGAGLGLALVARIVKQHGGRIWAESSPGEGATFFFTIDESRA